MNIQTESFKIEKKVTQSGVINVFLKDNEGGLICDVSPYREVLSGDKLSKLLAHAPDMRERLKHCVQLITSECPIDDKIASFLKECVDLIKETES